MQLALCLISGFAEFVIKGPHGKRREPTLASGPLTSTYMPQYVEMERDRDRESQIGNRDRE